jgi:hypothetical protein
MKDAFGAGIAPNHAIGIVVGMVGQGFDGDEITRLDLDHGLGRLAEVAPQHGVGAGRDVVVAAHARARLGALREGAGRHRHAQRAGRHRGAPRAHRIAQEGTARHLELLLHFFFCLGRNAVRTTGTANVFSHVCKLSKWVDGV